MCACVCLGFLVITLITRKSQQCMMKCFQKYNFPSLSFSHSLCLSHTLLPFLVRPAQNFKIPAHSRFHVIVVVVVAFFLHLINSTLTNIEIMCTGPTKMSPRAASSLRVSHQKTNVGTGTEIEIALAIRITSERR